MVVPSVVVPSVVVPSVVVSSVVVPKVVVPSVVVGVVDPRVSVVVAAAREAEDEAGEADRGEHQWLSA